ncbi:porin family protein [Ascidiimonas sp. W6]|uniref:porin family protein n=1 Tax=Ascidiimonas meishanensis TaxID=3128903 RepID=UPI0030EC348A
MKKLILFSVFALALVMTTSAQSFKFGAKAGANFASLNGDGADGFDGITNFHFGAVAEIGISDKFAFQPELLYSAQGASFSGIDLNLNYITLPLLAKFKVSEAFSIEAGPQVGFLVKDEILGEDVEADSFDYGLNLGLSYTLDSGLFFQGRYSLGLADIAEDADAKNGAFQLSVGYFFL